MKGSSGIRAQDDKQHNQPAPEKLKVGRKCGLQVFGQILAVTHSNAPKSLCEHRWPLLIGGAKNLGAVSVQSPVWLLRKVLSYS